MQTSTRKFERRVGFKAIQPRVSALRTILECRRVSFSLSSFPSLRISSLRFRRGLFVAVLSSRISSLVRETKRRRQEEEGINFHENFCLSVKDIQANTWTSVSGSTGETETRPRSDNENPSDPVIIWHCTLAELAALTIVPDVVNSRSWLLAT